MKKLRRSVQCNCDIHTLQVQINDFQVHTLDLRNIFSFKVLYVRIETKTANFTSPYHQFYI